MLSYILIRKVAWKWLSQCTYDVSTIWKSNKKVNELVDMIMANDKLMSVADKLQKLLAA